MDVELTLHQLYDAKQWKQTMWNVNVQTVKASQIKRVHI